MGPWASGRPCGSSSRRPRSSGVGCIRRPMCWTKCPGGSSPRLRPCFTPSGRRDESGGGEGVRLVRGDLPGEVRQGDGVPGQGPGGVTSVLRLPGRALDALADDQPDRIDVRYRAVADGQDEGEWFEVGLLDHGVQADGGGLEELAVVERLTVAGQGDCRGPVCRWGGTNRSRLTQPSSTTFDNCSPRKGNRSSVIARPPEPPYGTGSQFRKPISSS